ncbi:7TM diverse intracellular signaling domain-containing protein [Pseudobacteriovorax antillogorgiicola]|uniref:histidine kinase n=1 Tax=Pseudobacteriovorax antillogorgiicola TaxID=1513793 RepID=A0A1Y6CEL7_9BACT|nr:7TM diverse intracellular signaling domain-containing protein [Pseudobacteriovorax antillogorgiicola]TCS47692.1 Hpt domain-containing protein [Pseudobacteriovorax antillogorgiicola]SMF59493.1 Hpt domain-containing protein [Pseudobacteriovorax antillogorgiicola]
MIRITGIILGIFLCGFEAYAFRHGPSSAGMQNAAEELQKVRVINESWQAYWGDFYEPQDLRSLETRKPDGWVKLDNLNPASAPSNPEGLRHGTFRTQLAVDPKAGPYGVYIPVLRGASKVWINDKLYISEGVPGSSADAETPKMKVNVIKIAPESSILDIVVHHSSYNFFLMGNYMPMKYGPYDKIDEWRDGAILRDVFVLSSVLIMAFYHFALYLLRTQRKEPLFFGIFCMALMVITSVRGEGTLLFHFFENPNTILFYRFDFIAFPVAVGVMFYYCRLLYPEQIWAWLVKTILSFSAIFFAVVAFAPTYYAELALMPYQLSAVLGGFTLLFLLGKAVRKKEEGSLLFCLGFAAILVGSINDILSIQGVIDTIVISHMSLFTFILLQSILLSKRFSKAFAMLEVARAEIRELNAGLEKKVEDRTKTIRMILDHVQSGFLLVDQTLSIQPGFTKSCSVILGQDVKAGTNFLSLFDINDRDRVNMQMSMEQVFDDIFPEEVSIGQIKNRQPIGDRQILLQMAVIRDENDQVKWLLITVNDATHTVKMEKEAKLSQTLLKILQSQVNFKSLLRESLRDLEQAKNLVDQEGQKDIRILLHTLKGNFAAYGLDDIAHQIHKMEDSPTLTADHLDELIASIHQFLEAHSDILHIDPGSLDEKVYRLFDNDFSTLQEQLEANGASQALLNLCSSWIDKAKKVSFSDLVGPINKNTLRIAKQVGKDIEFVMEGGEEPIDPERLQYVVHSLIHLIRNSIDHGIEEAYERGDKSETGHIRIKVWRESNRFHIDVGDDGRGIDPEIIKKVAMSKDLINEEQAAEMSREDILKLIFRPGFSTRDEVSALSGRGVGMSALEEAVLELGGKINIETEKGAGTTFHISVPEETGAMEMAA